MVNINIASRFYLSLLHIQSAALFARRSGQIEKEFEGRFSGKLLTEYWGNVTASIFHAVAFLKATINEFFTDAGEEPSENRLNSNTKACMADWWQSNRKNRKITMMDRFDESLKLAGRCPFIRGKELAQDIAHIVKLRDSLMHYYPEWMNDGVTVPLTVTPERRYLNYLIGKFPTNPLMGKDGPFFPNRCLSYGCAQWVVESSLAYSDEFYRNLGRSAPYDRIRQHFRTI